MFSASFIFSKSTVHGTEFSIEKINLDHTVALTDCARRNNFEYPKHFEKEVYTELHIKNYLFSGRARNQGTGTSTREYQ